VIISLGKCLYTLMPSPQSFTITLAIPYSFIASNGVDSLEVGVSRIEHEIPSAHRHRAELVGARLGRGGVLLKPAHARDHITKGMITKNQQFRPSLFIEKNTRKPREALRREWTGPTIHLVAAPIGRKLKLRPHLPTAARMASTHCLMVSSLSSSALTIQVLVPVVIWKAAGGGRGGRRCFRGFFGVLLVITSGVDAQDFYQPTQRLDTSPHLE
jgi:hypothetical protein